MAVVVCTVYERDDPPVAGGSATPLGTLTRLVGFSVRDVLSTHGFNSVQLEINRHDSGASLIENQPGRWVTIAFPAIQTDPVLTVRLGPSHTVVIGESEAQEIIHVGGLGILSLGENAKMLDTVHAPDQPCRGSCPTVPERWSWRAGLAEPIAYGGIIVRAIEEGQNQTGTPLAPWNITFDRDQTTAGPAWPDIVAEIQEPVGISMIGLYRRIAEAGDVFLVERPDFDIDGYSAFGQGTFGTDRTSATFASDKVRIYAAPDDADSNLLTGLEQEGEDEPATHVLVKGMGDVHAQVAATWYTSGPARWASIEYRDSDDTDLLERVGAEWLRRQFARTVAREVEIKPGDDPSNGRYLPWKHLHVGDLHTIDAGGIDEAARLVAMRVELVPGANDATTEDAHRSLRVVLEYNETTGEEGEGIGESLGGEPGNCCGPRPPVPATPPTGGTPDTIPFQWHFNGNAYADGTTDYGWVRLMGGTPSMYDSGFGGHGTTADSEGRVTIPWSAGVAFKVDLDMMVRSKFPTETGTPERYITIRFRDGGSTLASFTLGPATLVGSYQHFSGSLTAPSGTDDVTMTVGARTRIDNVVVTIPGSGSAGTPGVGGDGPDDLLGDESGTYALGDHSHVHFDEDAPTVDDDETKGYKAFNHLWFRLDSLTSPTQVTGVWALLDADEGAAVWRMYSSLPAHTHDDIETGAYTTTDGTDDVTYVADAGATHTIEDPTANVQDITLTEAVTLTFPTPTDGKGFLIRLHPDGNAVTWDPDVVWPGGTAPTLDGALHIFGFISDGTSWYGAEYGGEPGGAIADPDDVRDAGIWQVIVSGTAPPVAVTTEAEDDWVYGWTPG